MLTAISATAVYVILEIIGLVAAGTMAGISYDQNQKFLNKDKIAGIVNHLATLTSTMQTKYTESVSGVLTALGMKSTEIGNRILAGQYNNFALHDRKIDLDAAKKVIDDKIDAVNRGNNAAMDKMKDYSDKLALLSDGKNWQVKDAELVMKSASEYAQKHINNVQNNVLGESQP